MNTDVSPPQGAAPPPVLGVTPTCQAALAWICRDLGRRTDFAGRQNAFEQAWALRSARRAARELEHVITTESATDETWRVALSSGALTLRALGAAVGPGARGEPRSASALRERLQAALAKQEPSARDAPRGYPLSAALARSAGSDLALAFLRLRVSSQPRSHAVADAEDRAIALALLSVHAALNMTRFGRAAGPPQPRQSGQRSRPSVTDTTRLLAASASGADLPAGSGGR
jgi:hypothetical protein